MSLFNDSRASMPHLSVKQASDRVLIHPVLSVFIRGAKFSCCCVCHYWDKACKVLPPRHASGRLLPSAAAVAAGTAAAGGLDRDARYRYDRTVVSCPPSTAHIAIIRARPARG